MFKLIQKNLCSVGLHQYKVIDRNKSLRSAGRIATYRCKQQGKIERIGSEGTSMDVLRSPIQSVVRGRRRGKRQASYLHTP